MNRENGTVYKSFLEAFPNIPSDPWTEDLYTLENGFLGKVAAQYFRVTHDAIRRYDGNHLILGCRFGGFMHNAVLQEMKEYFERFVSSLVQVPYIVGYHWFKYVDQPKEGRFDGENSNYGLVDILDRPWEILTDRMAEVNPRMDEVHISSRGIL